MTLEQLRTNKGFTIKEMAKCMGISESTYRKRENDFTTCKGRELCELYSNMDLSESELKELIETNLKRA